VDSETLPAIVGRYGRLPLVLLTQLLCCASLLFCTVLNAHAVRDVSFLWATNPEAVDGYRLYYKTGSSGPPYDGFTALEGPSPVETGNVTSFTLHGLSETETYYFALTAYAGTLESAYSQEIVLPPSSAGNVLPLATDASFSTTVNESFSARLSASDPDGDHLTYSIVSNGNLGSAVITSPSTGAFTYTPLPDASGSDTFTFRANDGTGDSNTATVSIFIGTVDIPPTAVIASSASIGEAPHQVQFDGSGSTDSDGAISAFSWDFGDGETAAGPVVTHTYTQAGTYSARLTVTDNSGLTGSASTPILVAAEGNIPPEAVIAASPDNGLAPLEVTFDGSGSRDPDGEITSYTWNFTDGATATGPLVTHVFSGTGVYTVTLEVTDDRGVASLGSIDIAVQAGKVPGESSGKTFPWNLYLPIITGGSPPPVP
jgi:PKD repeat protein